MKRVDSFFAHPAETVRFISAKKSGGSAVHFLEIVNRGYTGEVVSKDDWDMDHVVMPVMDVVDEFELEREDGACLLTDREQAKAFFEAWRKWARP